MDTLVHPRERTLGAVTLVLGVLLWLLCLVGTLGLVLGWLLLGLCAWLFVQSALVAHLRHTAVQVTPTQLPDLHQRLIACCRRLGIDEPPETYVLHGDGALNAFATRFLGREFVVLLSDVVDALEGDPEALNFYLGHELGHLRRRHLRARLWRAPVLWLPLLGAAYARACESTCDRHGLACCADPEAAARALALLAVGPRRWRQIDLQQYVQQARDGAGFWASFHELIAGVPWLTRRVARTLRPEPALPARHPLAYALALFVPYAGGRFAALPLVALALAGVLAAVAVPAYQDYAARARVAQAWAQAAPAREAVARFYERHQRAPSSLAQAGAPAVAFGDEPLRLDAKTMVLRAALQDGELRMVPQLDNDGRVHWSCAPGPGLPREWLPQDCRALDVP